MAIDSTGSTNTEDATRSKDVRDAPTKPYLFIVLHCDAPLLGGARYGLSNLDQLTLGRGPERKTTRKREGALRTLDLRLPGGTVSSTHARLVRSGETWSLEDAQSKNGSFVNGGRVDSAVLRDGDFIEIGPVILRFRTTLPASAGVADDLDSENFTPHAEGFATLLPKLAEQFAALETIARMPVPVLLLGETGSGKEVLARAVHSLSERPGPFVAVNCGGLTASLLESQLFGHQKGSFTGASRDEPGYVRSADRGTLFLDEIGDLPLPAQASLLRVIQEREVVPVGSTRPIKVDLRIVSATHRPLDQMVERGDFRGDLLARLSGYRHVLMPLRERIEDLSLLIRDLLLDSTVPLAQRIRFSSTVGQRLVTHRWPLNIRQLGQCLSVAAALAEGGMVEPAHLLPDPSEESTARTARAPADLRDPEALRRQLVVLLEKHRGRVSHVARDMGKARMQIHRWLERFGLDADDYRT